MPLRRALPRLVAAWLATASLLSLLTACDDGTAPRPAPSASSAPVAPDARAACQRVCERANRCGIEAAERIAASGSADDAKRVQAAKDREAASVASCVDACQPPAEADPRAAEQLIGCSAQTRCDTFAACLERAGGDRG